MMQLIVLGVLPGTDTQMSFELIANVFASITLIYLVFSLFKQMRKHQADRKRVKNEVKTYQLVSARINKFLLSLN